MTEKEEEPKLVGVDVKLCEKRVPVFTVFKNNSILKNIFLFDSPPPSISAPNSTQEEEILAIGRHPDCSITLDHPSISRFHLRLHSKPSSLQLSLIDLSSVHGTWVSGKKIEPGVQVELNEGDTVRLGGSSRLYMLHWVPISRAYDLGGLFVPPTDVLMPMKEREDMTNQDDDFCSVETNQIHSPCDNLDGLNLLISGDNMKVSPSAPPMPEFVDTSGYNEKEENELNDIAALSPEQLLKESVVGEIEDQQSDRDCQHFQALTEVQPGIANANNPRIDHTENKSREDLKENEISGFSSGLLLKESVAEIGTQQSDKETENPQVLSRALTGGNPTFDHNKDHLGVENEDNEISGFSTGSLLMKSVVGRNEDRRSDKKKPEALSRVLSGTQNANRPSINHKKNLSREERDENNTFYFLSRQLFKESLEIEYHLSDNENEKQQDPATVLTGITNSNSAIFDHIGNLSRDEHQEYEISGSSTGQHFKEIAADIENQISEKENDNPQAVGRVLTDVLNENSLTLNDYSVNLVDVFNSSLSDEDVDILCASEMDNEQDMPTSSCHTPFSKAIVQRKYQVYHVEQNHVLANFSSTGVHARQSLMNTAGKSEQRVNCSGDLVHSLSDEDGCIVVGKRSEAVGNRSSFEGNNELKEIRSISSAALEIESMNLSLSSQNIPMATCIEQLAEKNNLVQTFATNVSIPKDTDILTMRLEQRSDASCMLSRGEVPAGVDSQTGKHEWCSAEITPNAEIKLYKENMENEPISEALISTVEVYAEEIFASDKENHTPSSLQRRSTKKTSRVQKIKNSEPLGLSPLKSSGSWNIVQDEELFICSEKENFTPNTLQQRSTKEFDEEIKNSKPLSLSPLTSSAGWNMVQDEELPVSSDKENHTPKILHERKLVRPASKNRVSLNVELATKNRVSRVPFQSLLSDSSSKKYPNSETTIRSSNYTENAQMIEKNTVAGDNKRWNMVADTDCLLNKVSRKVLQLLQGVKGTRLIIPRIVIWELDCMKRRGYLFNRTNDVSLALEWIEECMINTSWWIQVQTAVEERRHLAPTPPVSPLSSSEGNWGFSFTSASFSASANFLEIVSPTAGDHVLECALHYRKMKYDENTVILSDDVSLKIKAMAEGMICEAPEEFRGSLVNPFSDRFLWAKSSPRGLTWSCADDIVLREKFYRGPFKGPSNSEESSKGLKLILLHNRSHFSQQNPDSFGLKQPWSKRKVVNTSLHN